MILELFVLEYTSFVCEPAVSTGVVLAAQSPVKALRCSGLWCLKVATSTVLILSVAKLLDHAVVFICQLLNLTWSQLPPPAARRS